MNGTEEKVVTLAPGKPDAEVAAELKKRIMLILDQLHIVMDEAMAAGFEVHYNTGLVGIPERHVTTNLKVYKGF